MSRFELLRVVTSKSRLIVRIEGTTIKASHSTTTYVRRIETGLNAFQFFCVVLFLFFLYVPSLSFCVDKKPSVCAKGKLYQP